VSSAHVVLSPRYMARWHLRAHLKAATPGRPPLVVGELFAFCPGAQNRNMRIFLLLPKYLT
jgi:hypothetical protein